MVYLIFRRIVISLMLGVLMIAVSPTIAQDDTTNVITRPQPSQTFQQGVITVDYYFETIPQGGVGLIHVYGDTLQGVRTRFLDNVIEFFPASDGYYGLLAVGMAQSPRLYDVSLVALLANEQSETFTLTVDVIQGAFIREEFSMPQNLVYLTSPEIERGELARLNAIFESVSEEVFWDNDGFDLPISTRTGSPFGSFRILNQNINTRHTGWDFSAGIGTPILASASGTIAYTGLMDIRGNYVAIDHGYGIYTGYAHMSQIHVTRGQTVRAGQIIGVVGSTGRSSGAHLHWEMSIHQQWVDTLNFLNVWLPDLIETETD